MKLKFSKKWYEMHIATEGDLEIGAGIPPGIRPQTHKTEGLSSEKKLHAVHVIEREAVKDSFRHHSLRRSAKACCHA